MYQVGSICLDLSVSTVMLPAQPAQEALQVTVSAVIFQEENSSLGPPVSPVIALVRLVRVLAQTSALAAKKRVIGFSQRIDASAHAHELISIGTLRTPARIAQSSVRSVVIPQEHVLAVTVPTF